MPRNKRNQKSTQILDLISNKKLVSKKVDPVPVPVPSEIPKSKGKKGKKGKKGGNKPAGSTQKSLTYSYKPTEEQIKILECIEKLIPEDYKQLDVPLRSYIACVIASQNNQTTAIPENQVISLLKEFFRSNHTDESLVDKIVSHLKEKELMKEVLSLKKKKALVLEKEINIGREYEKDQKAHQVKTDSNWNEDLDWERERQRKLEKKRQKRIEKERKEKAKEYQEYLEKRGFTSSSLKFVRMHNTEEIKGTRDIILENINMQIGNLTLLKDANVRLFAGRRYGLIGVNGIGKTTLLRNLVEREFEGLPIYLQMMHIEQEIAPSEKTALQIVLETDIERTQLLLEEQRILNSESNSPEEIERLNEIYERMEQIDAHSAESRAAQLLAGLDFTNETMNIPVNKLSGGWRMRVSIARGLFVEPDYLFLDEPNNHLAIRPILWLENYLRNYKKTLVIVSHSRSFLNNTTTDTLHFENLNITHYKGNYSDFEEQREKARYTQHKQAEAQAKQRKHIQTYVDRFRAKAATAKMAQSRLKMLEKMKIIEDVVDAPEVHFKFTQPEKVPPPHIQCVNVTFGYNPKELLFKKVNLNIDMDSRIALVGANGIGKTTLMNILTGDLDPLEGSVESNRKLRVSKFSQHHVDQLDLSLTPLEYFEKKYPKRTQQEIRNQLGRMGVTSKLQVQPIYTMSGGQKRRVSIADVTFNSPHILLLDEISNDLDIESQTAVVHALNTFEGGVLLISHDEYLIEHVCDEIYVIEDQVVTRWNGSFMDYRNDLIKRMNL